MIFDHMLGSIKSILKATHDHPFNQMLANGTLPEDVFAFYIMQDALYLADFSRALALTAAKLPNQKHMQQFIVFALNAISSERDLHASYIKRLAVSPLKEQSPTGFMYSNYLLKMTSLNSVEEAVSSLLPCFYIYNEVGKKMLATLKPDNPYCDWISLYAGELFEASVNTAINITNELGVLTSTRTREKMTQAFVRSAELEWRFWDTAYQKEEWQVYESLSAF